MTQPVRPILYKSTFAINYKPELRFYDLMNSAAQKLTDFPHWETDRLSVTLRDPARRCSIRIGHNLLAYAQDSSDTLLEEQQANVNIPLLLDSIEVQIITKLNCVRQFLVPVKFSFAELAQLARLKLFSLNQGLLDCLPSQFNDLLYRIDTEEDRIRYTITIAPIWKEQAIEILRFDKAFHLDPFQPEQDYVSVRERYPETALYIGVEATLNGTDPFSQNHMPYATLTDLDKNDYFDFIPLMRKKSTDIVERLFHYFFSTSLE